MAIQFLNTVAVDTDVLYVDTSSNRVGIGEPNPDYELHVDGQIYSKSSTFPVYFLQRETSITGDGTFTTTGGIASGFHLRTNSSGTIQNGFGGGIVFSLTDSGTASNTAARIYARRDGGNTTGALQFWGGFNGNSPLMTMRASGTVGIGTTSPAQKLDVNGNLAISGTTFVDSTRRNIYLNSFAGGGANGIFFRDGFTYNASITAEDHSGSGADGICISGYDGVSFSTGSNTKNERMRIGSAGQIGIGGANYGTSGQVLTSSGSSSAPSWQTPTAGDITGVTAGSYMTGGGTSGTVTLNANASTSATANTLAARDGSGDINVRLLRANYANQSTISGAMAFRVNNGSDNYTRYCSNPTAIRTFIGAGTSSFSGSYNDLSNKPTIPTNYLRDDAFDSGVGLYLQGGSFNAGTDTVTAPLVIDEEDFIYTKDGGYLRKLIGKTSNQIQIGHGGTGLITSINFLPGTAGNSAVKINSNTVWNAGNDGSGSGLDADLLDGAQGSSFLRSDINDVVTPGKQISFYSYDNIESSSADQASLEVFQDTSGADAFMQFHVNGDYAAYFGLDGSTNDFAVGGWSMGANKYKVWHAGNDGSGSGLDADLLDGIDSSRFVYGSNSRKTTNADPNSNTAMNSGFYDISSTNTPTATWYSYITMAHNNTANEHGHQIAGSFYSDGDLFNRHYNGTNASFGNWTRIWNAANDGSGSGLDADLLDGVQGGSYLRSDDHDTFTGKLSVASTNNRRAGVYGYYDSTRIGHIWSMGTGFAIPDNGANFGNLYGLAYKHTNNSTGGTMGGSHQMVWCNNGSARGSIGYNSVWHAESMKAPIFYDSIDTNYKLDPNSTSTLNKVLLGSPSGIPTQGSRLSIDGLANGGYGMLIDGAGSATNIRLECPTYNTGIFINSTSSFVTNAIWFTRNGTNFGEITINYSGTVSYNTTSDYRTKENVTEITDGIERVKGLQPKQFSFIHDDTNTIHDGFMAHEVQNYVPGAINGTKDEVDENGDPVWQGIDHSKLVPVLTAALQEAILKIEQLETRIQTLENQ
jgi:hypothetical protein